MQKVKTDAGLNPVQVKRLSARRERLMFRCKVRPLMHGVVVVTARSFPSVMAPAYSAERVRVCLG